MPIYDVLPVPPNPPVGGTLRYCVELPADRAYLSVILGCLSYGGDEESYDDPNTLPPDSSEIQAAFATALATIEECENTLIGTIQAASFKSGVSPPDGWIECNGGSHDVADYPDLVAISDFINVTGSTFTVPDMRRRMLWGTPLGAQPGTTGGAEQQDLSISNMPAHNHSISGISQFVVTVGAGAPVTVLIPASPGFPFNTGSRGSGSSFSIMNPYMMTDFYIVGR